MAGSVEKLLRDSLRSFGVRFRTGGSVLGSTPTVSITNSMVAVFVQDCYEDRCTKHYPKRRSLKHRKALDTQEARLRKAGWVVIRVWQHEVEENPKLIAGRVSMIVRMVRNVMDASA